MIDIPIEKFRSHIKETSDIPSDAWEDLLRILELKKYNADDFIVENGQLAVNEIFVVEGIIRGFYNSIDGFEANVVFYSENNVAAPCYTRTRDKRSIINLQALTDSTLIEFNTDKFTELRYRHESLMRYGNNIVIRELDYKTQREMSLLTNTAEERYSQFRKTYPGIENRISQYHIASFLGITPVSLSRIRKSIN